MELAATDQGDLLDEAAERDDAARNSPEGALEAQREELRRRLTSERFAPSFLERLVFRTGRAVQRLLRLSGPPSYWTGAGTLTGLLVLIFVVDTWIAARAGLNLVQSLLLPVAALVLANLQRILELLGLGERLGLGS